MIHDFDLYLAAMRVAGEAKLDAQARRRARNEFGLCDSRIFGMSRRISRSISAQHRSWTMRARR